MGRPTKFSAPNFYKDLEELSLKYKRLAPIEKSKEYGKHVYTVAKVQGLHSFLDGFMIAFGQEIAIQCKKSAEQKAAAPTAPVVQQPEKRRPGRPKKV